LDKLEERGKNPSANSVEDRVFVYPQRSTERKKIVVTKRRIVITWVKLELKTKIRKSEHNLTIMIKCDKK
jgi:hypothetical protein